MMAELEETCIQPCDPDCEVGPVHCEWVHLPNHKKGWHSQEDCPHRELEGEVIPLGELREEIPYPDTPGPPPPPPAGPRTRPAATRGELLRSLQRGPK
jgi:hypothetical protein